MQVVVLRTNSWLRHRQPLSVPWQLPNGADAMHSVAQAETWLSFGDFKGYEKQHTSDLAGKDGCRGRGTEEGNYDEGGAHVD